MTATLSLSPRFRLGLLNLAVASAALLAALTAPVHAQASKTVGIAAALVRDVQIKPAALRAFSQAKLRQRIAIADQLRTGADSRLQIALLDKTKISLGANARLTIDKFVFDPNGGSVSVNAAKGALRFISGPGKSSRSVNTPSATIGIRGTIFDTAVGDLAVDIALKERAVPPGTRHDPETATLAVLRGPGPDRQGNLEPGAIDVAAAGQTVALEEPLMAAYVPYAGAAPIGPFRISLPGLALLNDFILPAAPRREFEDAPAGQPVPNRDDPRLPPWMTRQGYPQPGEQPPPGYQPDGRLEDYFPPPRDNPPVQRPQSTTPPPPPTRAPPTTNYPGR